jgi:hypothetical protein
MVTARRRTIEGMRKAVVFVAVLAGLAAVARRFGPRMQGLDWDQMIERMPDNAPPKMILGNIKAIRENTERILDLLEGQAKRPS